MVKMTDWNRERKVGEWAEEWGKKRSEWRGMVGKRVVKCGGNRSD